jgi:hypothetical protein
MLGPSRTGNRGYEIELARSVSREDADRLIDSIRQDVNSLLQEAFPLTA